MTEHILDFCERKARDGDSGFAIAFALLELADAQKDMAKRLSDIGVHAFGTDAIRNPMDRRSCFEKMAVDLPEAIQDVAEAIRESKETAA